MVVGGRGGGGDRVVYALFASWILRMKLLIKGLRSCGKEDGVPPLLEQQPSPSYGYQNEKE